MSTTTRDKSVVRVVIVTVEKDKSRYCLSIEMIRSMIKLPRVQSIQHEETCLGSNQRRPDKIDNTSRDADFTVVYRVVLSLSIQEQRLVYRRVD